jgi:hypothetical protein
MLDSRCALRLRECRRKIYFDGYLPPRKWHVRRERLIKQSAHMKFLTSQYRAHGIRPDRQQELPSATGRVLPRATLESRPAAPFIVPSVIEALICLPEWAAQVQVVPGEADAYCAEDVRQHGGTVLTGDSDLLIENLGPRGSVAFFWDVSEEISANEEPVISAKTYSLSHIETRLGICGRGGLTRFAFEIKNRGTTFQQAVLRAHEHDSEHPKQEAAYQEFLREHIAEEYISSDHPITHVLSTLDPRISEFVIQSLNIEVLRQDPTRRRKQAPRGPEELSIFLPTLVDDHEKKSAWVTSQAVRELAYGLAQHAEGNRRDSIIEYTTLVWAYGGRRTDVPDAASAEEWCEQLVSTLERIETELDAPNLAWLAFTIFLEMQHSIVAEEKSSLAVRLVGEALQLDEQPRRYSWDIIHFTAQVQASLYSLRILKQVLDVRANLAPAKLSSSQQQLRSRLSGLPSLVTYPTVMSMFILLCRFGKADGLAVISRILGLPDTPLAGGSRQNVPRRKATGGNPDGQAGKPKSGNIFALLDEEDQDY